MFIFRELQHFLGIAIPIIVQIGVVYLIIRFTLAVSNVLVRLSALNRPPKPVIFDEEAAAAALAAEPVDAEFQTEENEPAALPEKTGEN